MPHQKHIPQRTCIGCREVQSKRTLIRVVKNTDGVFIDITGKKPGRGAYVHDRKDCWEKALKGTLEQALKTDITAAERERLLEFIETLQN